jgi:hypothetical protein
MANKGDRSGSKQAGGGTSPTHTSYQDARMGEITTAASSTMAAADYARGYPPNEGEILNQNFAQKGSKGAPNTSETRG